MSRFHYVLAACSWLSITAMAADFDVKNGGFEEWEKAKDPEKNTCSFPDGTKPSGWGVGERLRKPDDPKTGVCERDSKTFHSGGSSIKLELRDSKGLNRITRFNAYPVEANKFYRVSAWVRAKDLKSNPRNRYSGVMLQFIAGSKKGYWSDKRYEMKAFPLQGDTDWQKLSAVFRTRANDESTGIGVGLQKATGTIWVDDVTLSEATADDLVAQEKAERKSKVDATVWRAHYGPDVRQVYSLYCPKSDKPAPLLVYIHGGGWLGGDGLRDANEGRFDGMIKTMNSKGIAVAVINYRYSPLPAPVLDAARAIQFLRANAKKYNLDKSRVAATGFSAGATTSLWLATHDDLADPNAKDPVLRESSRLCGARVLGVQATIDPETIRKWKLEKAMAHQMICRAAGFSSNKEMDEKYESKKAVYKEYSPVTHIDKSDPPIRLEARSPLDRDADHIHHSRFAYEFYKVAKDTGADVDIVLSDKDKSLAPAPKDANGDLFLIRVLTAK